MPWREDRLARGPMPKFVSLLSWSSASWARMINNPDDRVNAARQMCDAMGATLESFYWLPLSTHDAVIIIDAPDTLSASAVTIAVTSSGAVHNIETYEALTQEQLKQALTLAADAREIYRPPGQYE